MSEELNVKAITRATGLNEHTLRAWERRYGAVAPKRLTNGHRVYTRDDLDRLRFLVQLQDRGFSIGQIAKLETTVLRNMLRQSNETETQQTQQSLPKPSFDYGQQIQKVVSVIEAAIKSYELQVIHKELNRARHKFGARSFALEVVGPIMAVVGRLVADGNISMAQEHAVSAIVKVHLGALLYNLQNFQVEDYPADNEKCFAITTMEGDQHEIGILISAVLCAAAGVRSAFLGASLPPQPLAEAAQALGATHILLGKAQLPEGVLVKRPEHYLRELSTHVPVTMEIWLGGDFNIDEPCKLMPNPCRFLQSFRELDNSLSALN